jgi:hypothetical protein
VSDGLTLLVPDVDHLRRQDRELCGLRDALFNEYQRLMFRRIVGETSATSEKARDLARRPEISRG